MAKNKYMFVIGKKEMIVTMCDGCGKQDANVMIKGKRYCKPCFDNRKLTYGMMDHVEENKETFETLGIPY